MRREREYSTIGLVFQYLSLAIIPLGFGGFGNLTMEQIHSRELVRYLLFGVEQGIWKAAQKKLEGHSGDGYRRRINLIKVLMLNE